MSVENDTELSQRVHGIVSIALFNKHFQCARYIFNAKLDWNPSLLNTEYLLKG